MRAHFDGVHGASPDVPFAASGARFMAAEQVPSSSATCHVLDDVARRAVVARCQRTFLIAVSSTRFDGVLRFGGVARSTATMV